jgi:hypothetical protein
MHGEGIEPPICPNTFHDRLEMSIFDELRVVLDVADPEWKSMILFGLYIGQRLAL